MSLSTYKKRSGTSDRGKDYEWLLCAFYALNFSTSSAVVDFELFTNNEFFGDLDDVALRVKFSNGEVRVFLLQLKHSEKTKTLALNSLTSPSGDFTLIKYMKSFEKIIALKNFYFILYVNKTAKFKDKTQLVLEKKRVWMREHSCVGGNLLNTSKSQNCSVFAFEKDFQDDFLANFYLYVNQQNDINLKQSISDLLKIHLHSDIYSTFIEFMRTWWTGNFKLTKYDVVAKLTELVLSPMIRTLSSERSNAKTKLLEDVLLKFNLTLVGRGQKEKIAKIWSKVDGNFDIKRVSLTAFKYGLITKGIGRIDDLSIEKKTKVLWFMDEVPLLVEVDDFKTEQIDAIIHLLESCEVKKKIILIGYSSESNFTNWTVFKDLSNVPDDEGLRSTVAQTFTCSLQGKQAISLKELGISDNLLSKFEVDQLLDIATQTNFNVGEFLETLPSIYIPRSFYKVFLNFKVIDSLSSSRIFLSYNNKQDIAQSKFSKRSVDISCSNSENFQNFNVFTCDSEFTKDKIAKEFSSDTPSHHFRVVDGQNLQWLNTSENIEEIESFKRMKSGQIFSEGEIEAHHHKKIKILTSHTGTGKTTFLNQVKNNSPPNCFVIKMDLKDHFGYFKREEELHNWDSFLEFVTKIRNYNKFETELLRNFDKSKIVILWDSLDELPVESSSFFIKTAQAFHSEGITQWIAAQNRFKTLLEHTFETFVLTMLPFSREEQIFYIQNQCKISQDAKVTSFIENIRIIDNDQYLGVPLQLYVLSEIFSTFPLLNKIYTLTDMMTAFIEAKYFNYIEKIGDFRNIRRSKTIIEDALTHRLDQYRIAAFKTYLPELYETINVKNTIKFLSEMKEGDFLGLIERVDQENNFIFEHQIFGEFLCASYLADNFPPELEKIIFEDKFRSIRFMFDLLLTQNEPTFVAILYKNYDNIGNHIVKDGGGRNPLHVICSYGVKHPSLNVNKSDYSNSYVIERSKSTDLEDAEDLKRTLKRLCQIYSPREKDNLFKWTSFDYADHSNSLGLLECLEGVEEVIPKLYNYDVASILFYSVKFNYSKIFASVKQLPYIEDTNNNSLIHLSVEFNREDFLIRLLSQNVYKTSINKVNEDDWSPLHIATFNGNLPLIKLLLNKGATFVLRQPSVMSLAVAKGRKDIVEFFLDCGCSPNEFYHSNHFTTSIFQAITQKHDTIVELLLRNGARLYCINRASSDDIKPNPFGMNLFHMLLENEHFEEADMVLKKGIHIDSVDNKGRTAFHHAAYDNQERVIKYLFARGGNQRILDKTQRSPFHSAAQGGSVEVGKMLIATNIDINLQDSDGLTPLHTAVLAGSSNFITFLVDEGVDPNIGNKYGRTPLHLAATYDLSECVESLCRLGVNMEARDGLYGRTPLHLASWNGNDQCVEIFLRKGVPVDCCCNFGFTPLHLAAERAAMKSCQLLLEAGASVFAVNRNGKTPLDVITKGYMVLSRFFMSYDPVPVHSAVRRGDVEFIEELFTLGFDVNGVDSKGNTPLHLAVCCPNAILLVEALLERKCDVKKVNQKGFTAFHYALQSDYFDLRVIRLLLEADIGNCIVNSATDKGATPLHITTQNSLPQFEAIVECLLEKGAKTDVSDDLGFTPLHYAASCGNLNMVTLLVKADSDVNRRSKSGRTPLHLAATRRHLSIVNLLLQHQALIQEDSSGDTPLHDALKAEESRIFKALYDQVPDFDVGITYLGRTILHVAAKNGVLHLVKFFLERGVVGGVDADGCTVLEEALYNRHYEVFDFLLEKNSFEFNKFNQRYGKYPLHVVTTTGTKRLVEFFLKKGAKVDTVDDDGNTPLHIAVDCRQKEIFMLLLQIDTKAVNVRNKKGQTVLHKVVEWNDTDLVNILIKKDANVDITDNTDNTPFDFWFHMGMLEYTDVLFKMKSFDVNKKSSRRQMTLFHLAVYYKSEETINWLREKGASIACEDSDGDTPLHYAVTNPKIFFLLLQKWKNFIDLEKANHEGETILHLAATSSPQIVEKLLEMGASPHATTKYGAIPLLYSLKNPKCFKILWKRTPEVDIFNLMGHTTKTPLHIAALNGDLDSVKFFLQVGLKINEADDRGDTPLNNAVCPKVLKALLEKDTKHNVVNLCGGKGYSLLHCAVFARNLDLVKLLVRFKAMTNVYDFDGKTAADIALEYKYMDIYEFLKEHENSGSQSYFYKFLNLR